jgi:hypothetical protein
MKDVPIRRLSAEETAATYRRAGLAALARAEKAERALAEAEQRKKEYREALRRLRLYIDQDWQAIQAAEEDPSEWNGDPDPLRTKAMLELIDAAFQDHLQEGK